jgi:peroxiredoxin
MVHKNRTHNSKPLPFLAIGFKGESHSWAAETSLPQVSLLNLEGQSQSLESYKGKTVLVDLWATWCSTCKASIPTLNEWNAKYAAKGLVVLGVSTDQDRRMSVEKLKKFKAEKKMSYEILWDKEDKLSKALNSKSVPSLFLFDSTGRLVKSVEGYDEEHAAEMTAQLDQLLP